LATELHVIESTAAEKQFVHTGYTNFPLSHTFFCLPLLAGFPGHHLRRTNCNFKFVHLHFRYLAKELHRTESSTAV